MKKIKLYEEFTGIDKVTEAFRNGSIEEIHFEIDPKRAEELKIAFGKSTGERTTKSQIATADYSLKKFRKEIGFGKNDKYTGVFYPGSYAAALSKLGDGPHAKAAKKVKWTQKKYDQWLEDVASNDGWKHSYDMAQNASSEPGLIAWVKKEFRGDDPLQRIQWDIEGFSESVDTEKVNFVALYKNKGDKNTITRSMNFNAQSEAIEFLKDIEKRGGDGLVATKADAVKQHLTTKKEWDTAKKTVGIKESESVTEAKKPIIVIYKGRRLVVEPDEFKRLKLGKDIVGMSSKYPGQEEWILAKGDWKVEESTVTEGNKVTFTLDDGDLDDKFLSDKGLSRNLDYKEDGKDTYYVLPKRDFDRLQDWADSSGYDTDEIIDVIEESKINEAKALNRAELTDYLEKYLDFLRTTEEFDGTEGGIWTSAENGETLSGSKIFDYYSESSKYEFGVLNKFAKLLSKSGWYAEFYDPGTVMIWEE